MLTKSHCGGNLIYLGPFCAGWVSEQAYQRRKSRGISAAFLSVHHPSSQSTAGCRYTVKMKGWETLGSFLVLSLLGFWAFSLSWSWWLCVATCQTPFSKAGCVWSAEIHPWDCPQDGMVSRDADSPLGTAWLCPFGTSSQVGQELWLWLCGCQTLFLKQPKCTESLQEPRVLCFAL